MTDFLPILRLKSKKFSRSNSLKLGFLLGQAPCIGL